MASEDEKSINEKGSTIIRELLSLREDEFDQISKLLSEFKVLTREKTLDTKVLDMKCVSSLIHYSSKHIEAQKCLSNLILNYSHLRHSLIEPYTNCVDNRLKSLIDKDKNENPPKPDNDIQEAGQPTNTSVCPINEILYFDLRIIFLLSALCPESRLQIREKLVDSILRVTLKEAREFRSENYLLVIESLKTLFNLTIDGSADALLEAEVFKELFAIVESESYKDCARENGEVDITDQLLVNLIHLLINMPKPVYLSLSDAAADKILRHLDIQLKTYSKSSFKDTLLPVLNVCKNICLYNPTVRERWFEKIIGSSQNFEKRPEEYDTLKGRLIKLMTSVDVHVKDIAADFLLALCDGDTEKFITYTGFGNSAAFLSSRGLLSQSARDKEASRQENIDKKEQDYLELRDKLDPITGRLEITKRNPMEGMTDEEKEWHAHELAGAIVKLSNLGIVKPMGVDGLGEVSELKPRSSENKEQNNDDKGESE